MGCSSHYVNAAAELNQPEVSPLRATELRGLPPALIIAAAAAPLGDYALRHAERLPADGGIVESRVFDQMPHGFWLAPGVLPQGHEAITLAATRLRSL